MPVVVITHSGILIKIYNRKTEQYDIEKVAGEGFLNYLYSTQTGRAGLQLLIKRKIYSSFFGFLCNTRISARKIESFIKEYNINREEFVGSVEEFKCFNDFFTRRLKIGERAFDSNPDLFLSPGDGRIRVWQNIDTDNIIQIKGITYSLSELLENAELSRKYQDGTCIVLRLAPVDYHRFHFMDSGICSESIKVKGAYYSVNPIALDSIPQLFCRNKREYSILKSDNFGDVAYIEVGATSVGSIIQSYTPSKPVARGDEKGYFKFGGSTIVLLLEKDAVQIDEEILMQTEIGYEVKVLAGERIGTKSKFKR